MTEAGPTSAASDAKILIIDDEPANVRLLNKLLQRAGYSQITGTSDSREAATLFRDIEPDLVLLDLNMPFRNGFEVLGDISDAIGDEQYLPVLVLTADVTEEAKERALEQGAKDFLTKPFGTAEVLLRCRNLIETRMLHQQMNSRVIERTMELEESRIEILDRLARTAEFRDDATGQHTKRVGELSGRIAAALGLSSAEVEHIRRAAPLHDLGKVGIPDHILLKQGKLTEEEFAVMKTHTLLGADLLSGGRSPLMRLAEQIARSHHERWDGGGYPEGTSGESIPLPARIAAVADFFDALTHDRPYRKAWPLDLVLKEISAGAGSHFDPQVVKAFMGISLTESGG